MSMERAMLGITLKDKKRSIWISESTKVGNTIKLINNKNTSGQNTKDRITDGTKG